VSLTIQRKHLLKIQAHMQLLSIKPCIKRKKNIWNSTLDEILGLQEPVSSPALETSELECCSDIWIAEAVLRGQDRATSFLKIF